MWSLELVPEGGQRVAFLYAAQNMDTCFWIVSRQ